MDSNGKKSRTPGDPSKKPEDIPPIDTEDIKPPKLELKNYWIFVVIRFILIFLPQNGYIHPDEFFQSVEVLTGDVFDLDVTRAWEFNTSFPLRSIAVPTLTVALPCQILKWASAFSRLWLKADLVTPYVLLVLPRLAMATLSLVADFCLWHMCWTHGQNYAVRLTVFASSYAVLIFGSRNFSNTVEMVLFAMLLCFVVESMHFSDEVVWREDLILKKYKELGREHPAERAKLARMRSSLPAYSLRHCAPIAFITVAGVFNRPTFLTFALPAVFCWLQRGMGSRAVGWSHFHLRVVGLGGFALLSAVPFILIDSVYYGYLTMAEIISLQLSIKQNFVVTPINFLLYNSNTTNLAKHGLHPRWLHTVVNVPLMFNILGIAGLVSTGRFAYLLLRRRWLLLPKTQSVLALMHASFLVPLLLLSIFPHQEPRFLLPLIIPLTFLHAQSLRLTRKYLMPLWYVFNAVAVFFFGFLHQGGIWGLVVHLNQSGLARPAPLNSLHLISTHIYPIPKFPLLLPSTTRTLIGPGGRKYRATRRVHLHEADSPSAMGVDVARKVLEQCAKDWKNHRLKCHVYCTYPGTLQHEFQLALDKYNVTQGEDIRIFYPHLSTEAMPQLWGSSCDVSCLSFRSYVTRKIQEFGLILVPVSLPLK